MRHPRIALLVVLGSLAVAGRQATADELGIEQPPVFRERWVVSLWMGAPAGVGYSLARSVGDRWRVKAAVGTPMMINGVGGAADLVRGTRLGPVTLWLGATVAGYVSDNCSWGGCGE